MIAYKIIGNGPENVLVMHDWFCDSTSYDAVLPWLDTSKYKYAFVDLRGYGQSKFIAGNFDVAEAFSDVLEVCDALGFNRFHLVGHSMSGMIAQYCAAKASARLKSVVAITPVPACGSPAPQQMMDFMISAASHDTSMAKMAANTMSGQRLCDRYVATKAAKWWDCSTPEARVAYLKMFSNTDFSNDVQGNQTPILVITGEHDIEGYRLPAAQATIGSWFANAEVIECKNSAHYPMQETPIFLATQLERFFAKHV